MPEPIPNVPVEHCEKIASAIRSVSTRVSKYPRVPSYRITELLDAIAKDLDKLAEEIRQDQSGEI